MYLLLNVNTIYCKYREKRKAVNMNTLTLERVDNLITLELVERHQTFYTNNLKRNIEGFTRAIKYAKQNNFKIIVK